MLKKLIPYLAAAYFALAPAPVQAETYQIKENDCLGKIAQKKKIPLEELLKCNSQLKLTSKIYTGKKIKIADDYIIQPNDSLWGIARQRGITIAEILKYNHFLLLKHFQPLKLLN